MSEDTGRAILKWALAILLLAGVSLYALQNIPEALSAGVAFGGEEDASASPSAEATTVGPVTDGEAAPTVDFALVGSAVSALAVDGMTVGPGPADGVVLSFPAIPGTAQCVGTAAVEMTVRSGTPTEFALYPSALQGLASLTEAAPVTDPYIPVAAPVLASYNGTPGPLTWDVLPLYQTYASGGTFDNGVAAPAIGSPFTVVVRPNDEGQEGRTVLFASAESPDSRPRLVWTGLPGCAG